MADTQPPTPPGFPPPLQPETPTPPKKNRTNLIIIGSAAAVIAAIVATGIVVVQSSSGDSQPAATAASSTPAEDAVTAATEEPDPTPTYAALGADDFTIELRTTKRQCFGSAGCNLTVEPNLTYLGLTEAIDPDAVYEITYEIHGDESGPVIETAELTDRTSLNYTPSLISTASAGKNVTVEITDVTTQAG